MAICHLPNKIIRMIACKIHIVYAIYHITIHYYKNSILTFIRTTMKYNVMKLKYLSFKLLRFVKQYKKRF